MPIVATARRTPSARPAEPVVRGASSGQTTARVNDVNIRSRGNAYAVKREHSPSYVKGRLADWRARLARACPRLTRTRSRAIHRISPFTSTVILGDRSPFATAVATSAMLRTWSVRFDAIRFTFSVKFRQTSATREHGSVHLGS